jgi:thymidylate synthase
MAKPLNIASCTLLTMMVAQATGLKVTGLEPGDFVLRSAPAHQGRSRVVSD